MVQQQLDYQFAAIPKKLMYCLDRNCRSMLFALVDLVDFYDSKSFYRSNEDLQKDADISKNLVIATLDTLYQAGLIDVDCVGKGTGRKTNVITVHTEYFKEWEKYTFDEVRNSPELKINTIKYKGSGFRASYQKKEIEVSCYPSSQEQSQTSSQQVSQKVNTIEETIKTQYSKETIESKEIKNVSQKVNTCKEDSLPTCKIDIIEEEKSLKEFEKETYQEMKESFNFFSSKIKLNDNLRNKGYECCEHFLSKYKDLDYQLLVDNSQQFLQNNEIKIGMLSSTITSSTGVSFSKTVSTELLKEYVLQTIPA